MDEYLFLLLLKKRKEKIFLVNKEERNKAEGNNSGLKHYLPPAPKQKLPPLPVSAQMAGSPRRVARRTARRTSIRTSDRNDDKNDFERSNRNVVQLSPSLIQYGAGKKSPGLWNLEIEKMLKNPPNSWKKLFKSEGISENPTLAEVLSLLDETAGSNISGERESSPTNPKKYYPPQKVRDEAFKGVKLSYENNYPSYKGIGLARGIQLATQEAIWRNSVERMSAFFKRNARYENLSGFGDDQNPSNSYLAWLNWGGSSGRDWVEKL